MFIKRLNHVILFFFLAFYLSFLTGCFSNKQQSFQSKAVFYELSINKLTNLGYTIPTEDIELSAKFNEALAVKNSAFIFSYQDQIEQRITIINDVIEFNKTYTQYQDIYAALNDKGYDSYTFDNPTPYFIYPLEMDLLTAPILNPIKANLESALTNFSAKPVSDVPSLDKSTGYYINVLQGYEKYNYQKLTTTLFESCKYMPYKFNIRPYLKEVFKLEQVFSITLSNPKQFKGFCSFEHLYYDILAPQRVYTVIDSIDKDFYYRLQHTITHANTQLAQFGTMDSPVNGIYLTIENKLSNVQYGFDDNKLTSKLRSMSETFSTKEFETVKLFYIKDSNNVFIFPKQVFVNNQEIDLKKITSLPNNIQYNVDWGNALNKK